MEGQVLSHYQVLERLGGGGMGIVYRAKDLNLGRFVALKFLAADLTRDALAKQRFVQEAKAASALDHSNICTIHEIAETPDGQSFIVMAYYEGETLKKRVTHGPLKIDDALDIAIGIGLALGAAHESGIVHRDIKPANVMLTRRGEVKVVDFGVAKLTGETGLTQTGVTLGTIAYMSPEQVSSGAVDQRSDLWSLGVVLYEMVSGRLPFDAADQPAMLHALLYQQPAPLTSLRTGVPLELDRIVSRALAKQPADRYQTAADFVSELRRLRRESDRESLVAQYLPPSRRRGRAWIGGAIGLAVLAAIAGAYVMVKPAPSRVPTFANLAQITNAIGVEDYPDWSPDGRTIAYESDQGGNWDIWIGQTGGAPINRTADHTGIDRFPVWSPDGRQIAFWSDRDGGGYFVMPALSGLPRRIAASPLVGIGRPQWSNDGSELACVVLGTNQRLDVDIVSVETGSSRRVALPGLGAHFDLSWSPNERFFSYISSPAGEASDVSELWMVRAADGKGATLTDGRTKVRGPMWSRDARVLYYVTNRQGPMDVWRQSMTRDGTPVGEPERVTTGLEVRQAAFSRDESRLAYSRGRPVANVWRVPVLENRPATWADAEQLTFDQAYIEYVDVSHDGRRLLVSSDRSGNHDIWMIPVGGGQSQQLTTDPAPDWAPRWSPDERRIAFYAYRSGNRDIWTMPVEGGAAVQVTRDPVADLEPTWSPDGKQIAYLSGAGGGAGEIFISSADGSGRVSLTQGSGIGAGQPSWSPDGALIAFTARSPNGQNRIWQVRPDKSDLKPLTRAPAESPQWSRDGRRLYFVRFASPGGDLWSVARDVAVERQVTALTGRRGRLTQGSATDGRYLYFSWEENLGDIWVMDVADIGRR